MKKRAFTLTEALVTLIVMAVVTVAGMNIVANNVKKGGGVSMGGGSGCPWEVVCSNDSEVQAKYKAPKCTEYDGKFDVDHIYYMIAKESDSQKDPAFLTGMVVTYTEVSKHSNGSRIASGDGWEDYTVLSHGTQFRVAAKSMNYFPWWSENIREHGLAVYPEPDFATYGVLGDAFRGGVRTYGSGGKYSVDYMPMAMPASNGTRTGYHGNPSVAAKNYDESLQTIYRQAFSCKASPLKAAQEETSKEEEPKGSDWDLIKKWFSIDKLKEIAAMDDSDPDKIIKSGETLLDVVIKNQGKKTICGGKSGVSCASYTGSFDTDHLYYVTVTNNTKQKVTYPASVRINSNNTAVILGVYCDGATTYYVIKENNKPIQAFAQYSVLNTNINNIYFEPNGGGKTALTVERIVAEPLE